MTVDQTGDVGSAIGPFTAASHDDVLRLVLQVAVLLFAARALGVLSRRFKQPAVVGEILAGVILGPSILSAIFPAFGQWVIPQTPVQGYLLEVISLIGAMFLMLMTGLEADLALIRRHARTAFAVSIGGIIVTFTGGFLLGQVLPESVMGRPDERMVFALFLGTAMSISAIAVIAKVIIDMGLMRRDVGQTILAAGTSDDTIGWILLSIVAALASGHVVTFGTVLRSAGSVLAFMLLSFTVGRWIVRKLLDFVQDHLRSDDYVLSLMVVLTFAWGAISQALNLEAVLGAFLMGILFGQMRRLSEEVREKLESIAIAIFAPVFFAVAGLKVDLGHLMKPRLAEITLLVIVVTAAAKLTGTYLGARLIGRKDHWTALSFGAGLNTRGAMDIIIATIGLSLGIFSQDMFTVIVVMAIVNSVLAPTALRWVLKRVTPTPEEIERLQKEELAAESIVGGIHRVLLPVRLRDVTDATYSIEARLLEKMGRKRPMALTLLTVARPGEREKATEFLERVGQIFPQGELTRKVVEGTAPSEVILDEAEKGYDLIVLGATQDSNSRVLFNPMVDYLLRVSPCPTLVVKSAGKQPQWATHRILVPTNGTEAARRAAELGFALAAEANDRVIALTVVTRDSESTHLDADGNVLRRQVGTARQIVEELRELGETHGVTTDAEVRIGRFPEAVIVELAKEQSVDLIILGTDIRPASQRLYLGPRVERILNNAPCPVVVFNAG